MDRRWSMARVTPLVLLMMVLAACGSSRGDIATGAQPAESQAGAAEPAASGDAAAEPAASDAAAAAGGEQAAAAGMIEELSLGSFGGGSNPQVNYNPFSPNVLLGDGMYIYEPLMALNTYSCEYVPWLAESYEWQDPQNLQLTIREGINWNDGQPFTRRRRRLHVQPDQGERGARPARPGQVDRQRHRRRQQRADQVHRAGGGVARARRQSAHRAQAYLGKANPIRLPLSTKIRSAPGRSCPRPSTSAS